jgi:hypothetical protein
MMQSLAQKQQVRLESKLDSGLALVHAEPTAFSIVLRHLVDNRLRNSSRVDWEITADHQGRVASPIPAPPGLFQTDFLV